MDRPNKVSMALNQIVYNNTLGWEGGKGKLKQDARGELLREREAQIK